LTKLPGAARAGTKRQCSLFDGGLGLKRERRRVLASGGLSNLTFYCAHTFRAATQQNRALHTVTSSTFPPPM